MLLILSSPFPSSTSSGSLSTVSHDCKSCTPSIKYYHSIDASFEFFCPSTSVLTSQLLSKMPKTIGSLESHYSQRFMEINGSGTLPQTSILHLLSEIEYAEKTILKPPQSLMFLCSPLWTIPLTVHLSSWTLPAEIPSLYEGWSLQPKKLILFYCFF